MKKKNHRDEHAPSSSSSPPPRTANAFAIEDCFNATDFPDPVRKSVYFRKADILHSDKNTIHT